MRPDHEDLKTHGPSLAADHNQQEKMTDKQTQKSAAKEAVAKDIRVQCLALETTIVKVAPGRHGTVAKGGYVVCSKKTAELLKGKLQIIGEA